MSSRRFYLLFDPGIPQGDGAVEGASDEARALVGVELQRHHLCCVPLVCQDLRACRYLTRHYLGMARWSTLSYQLNSLTATDRHIRRILLFPQRIQNMSLIFIDMLRTWKSLTPKDVVVVKHYFYYNHHHQPINDPTAGAQAFLMDYTRITGLNPHREVSAGLSVND
jgi:hypothetical protein